MNSVRSTGNARHLRQSFTDAERSLWRILRNRHLAGHKFRRQSPIGPYIVDFVCFEQRLIIEVDGGRHQSQVDDDNVRTEWLESQGFKVLRFWNSEALGNIDGVAASILDALEHPHPSLLPFREKGQFSSPSTGEDQGEGASPSQEEWRGNNSVNIQDTK